MPVKKILVVDDSPTERHVLFELLSKHGYQVITAESGEEGIEKAKAELPDLVLMEITNKRTDNPTCGAARPTPCSAYIVSYISAISSFNSG